MLLTIKENYFKMSRIDKEEFGVTSSMNRRNIARMKELSDKNKDTPIIPSHHIAGPLIHPLYKALSNCKNIQTFVFTETLFQTLDNMNCDNILGSDAVVGCLNDNQVGRLIDKRTKVNAEYAVVDGALYCDVYYKTEFIGCAIYLPLFKEYDKSYKDGVQILPQSPVLCYNGNIPPRLIESYSQPVRRLKRDFPDGIDFIDDNSLLYDKDWSNLCDSGIMIEDFKVKKSAIWYALKMWIYLKTAKEITQEYIPDNTPTYKRGKGYVPLNYMQVDATWNKNIDVNSPFPVSGHFRHQPKKDSNGEWYKELIYIEAFMKHGYHRKAKKQLLN